MRPFSFDIFKTRGDVLYEIELNKNNNNNTNLDKNEKELV